MAKAELEKWMVDNAVTVEAEFVPWSKSRNAETRADGKPVSAEKKSLNWRITVKKGDRVVVSGVDYSAGIAHCPAYKRFYRGVMSIDVDRAITFETEHGKESKGSAGWPSGKPIEPDLCDVLSSLSLDADVIDRGSFEEWAGDYGYDTDSRKAEAIYRACLEIALKLRAGLGEEGLRGLREAAQDY